MHGDGHDGDVGPPHTHGRLIRGWARLYDPLTSLVSLGRMNALRRKAIAVAHPLATESVLDVGCGTGALAFEVKRVAPGAQVRGIDASPEMVAVARGKARRRARVEFDVAAIERLPFGDSAFDLVVSGFMLHHLPGDTLRDGLSEVARVLKPGGRFVAADFSGAAGGWLGHVAAAVGHGHSGSQLHSLLEAIRGAGFSAVEVVPTGHRSVAFIRAHKERRGGPGEG